MTGVVNKKFCVLVSPDHWCVVRPPLEKDIPTIVNYTFWLQLHSKFPWIHTVRRDVKWHNVCKVMYLSYIHMKHQKAPFYAFLGVPVLLHRTKGAGPRLSRLHKFSSGMRFDQHLSSSSNKALVDYASIILGIVGASEHEELCWYVQYTFLIRWPEYCKLAISFDQVHCSLIPSNKFMFTARIVFRGLHTAFSNARIQPLR